MAISFRTMSKQKRKEKPTTFVTVVYRVTVASQDWPRLLTALD
jgi:hypothetical protein